MKVILTNILIIAFFGAIVATINRLLIYADKKQEVERKQDGKIFWEWILFHNLVRILVGVIVAVFVGVVILPHITILDIYSTYAIAAMSAMVGEQLWVMIGEKIKNTVDKFNEPSISSRRRSQR